MARADQQRSPRTSALSGGTLGRLLRREQDLFVEGSRRERQVSSHDASLDRDVERCEQERSERD